MTRVFILKYYNMGNWWTNIGHRKKDMIFCSYLNVISNVLRQLKTSKQYYVGKQFEEKKLSLEHCSWLSSILHS